MSEMVERVARALARSAGAKMTGPGRHRASDEIAWRGDGAHLDEYVELHWRKHEHAATFAIEAVREPTEAMFRNVEPDMSFSASADTGEVHYMSDEQKADFWRRMVDEMLK